MTKYVFIQNEPFLLPKVLDKYLREFADSTAGINIQSVAQGKRTVFQTAMDLYRVYGFWYFQWKLRKYLGAKIKAKVWNDILGSTRHCYSVKAVAKKYGVPVTEAVDVNSEEFRKHLRDLGVEFIVSISGTQLYKKALRAQTPKGIVNCHGALLPKYRGLMPSFWTLLNREPLGGVSVHYVDEKLDNGPILVQKTYRVHPRDTLEEIMARSKDLAAEAIIECVRLVEAGNPPLIPNDASQATHFSMPTPEDIRALPQQWLPVFLSGTSAMEQPIVHALSFDIEDWFHMVEIKAVEDPASWPSMPTLVERYTTLILDILDEHKTRATFFILGWVAEKHPALVPEIARRGHEIATHSFWHRRVDRMRRQEFMDDMRQSIDLLEGQSGKKILGFRAPSFSITPGTEWAFDVLLDLGLKYDASLFPARRGQGGYACPQAIHDFKAPSGRKMPELPMSIMRVAGAKLPFSGGGYLRLIPRWVIQKGFGQFEKKGIPVVVYLHPRDFAPDCPRVPMPLHRRFKCYVGTHTTQGKLRMMIEKYRFSNCADVLGISN